TMPTSRASVRGAFSANCRRWTLLDLYEQCSDHITEYMVSSALVGRRPRISRIRAYSSSRSPSSAYGCGSSGVAAACSTVSMFTGAPPCLARRPAAARRCCAHLLASALAPHLHPRNSLQAPHFPREPRSSVRRPATLLLFVTWAGLRCSLAVGSRLTGWPTRPAPR